jgi:hypothetical protein
LRKEGINITYLGKAPEQSSLCEQRTMDIAAPRASECVITFDITGGIFGVGRLAARLDELSESRRIGAWHIGPWVDWRHRAIRIKFDGVEDGKLSEHIAGLALQGAASVAGLLVTSEAMVAQVPDKSAHGHAAAGGGIDF